MSHYVIRDYILYLLAHDAQFLLVVNLMTCMQIVVPVDRTFSLLLSELYIYLLLLLMS